MTKLPPVFSVLLLSIIGFPSLAWPSEPQPVERLIQQAKIKNIHEDPYWLALGHYQRRYLGGYKSDVFSKDFFLSEHGRNNPEEELKATIEGLFQELDSDSGNNPNLHAQCRFIARFNWLKNSLDWSGVNLPKIDCEGFRKWSFDGGVESVSLIFATGYLGNPASFFGHPLLKFNLSRKKVPSFLFDTSVNYGAITPPQENPFVYAFKGLMGGYTATFSHRNFFYNTHNYSENELRDMWEYELNLSPDEVNQILWHTWELLGKNFSYYFLADNCASRMAEHMELVLGVNLLPDYVPWAIPYTLFDSLAHEKKKDGTPIVKRFSYIPSRQARLREKYLSLSEPEIDAVHAIVADNEELDQNKFVSLSENHRSRVIETLMDYYEFRTIGMTEDGAFKKIKARLLAERIKLPAMKWDLKNSAATSPHDGQRAVLTGVSAVRSEKFKSGFEFRLRPAYYDFLALDAGRPAASSVGIFDFTFAFTDKKIRLKKLDFISVETLNISQTGLPADGGYAWKLGLGLEPQDQACTSCSIFKVEVGFGKAFRVFDDQIFFTMLDGRIQTSAQDSGHLALTPNIGTLLDISNGWKMINKIGYRMYLDGTATREPILSSENRFGTWRDWDIRLTYERHVDNQAKVSLNYYW